MTESPDNDFKIALYELADELGQLILREHQILQVEMKQLGTLVKDAVNNLDSNFRDINASANEQTDILNTAFLGGCIDESKKRRFTEITSKINTHTASAIRVLQFDDIVQQLAGHTCERIARMQELFNEIEALLLSIKNLKSDESGEILKHISLMQEEVVRFRIKLDKENPVKQISMEEGRIELF